MGTRLDLGEGQFALPLDSIIISGVDDEHLNLVLGAINNNLYYFSRGNCGQLQTSNLWYELLANGQSLRRFTNEWTASLKNLLKVSGRISLWDELFVIEPTCLDIYNLGLHDEYYLKDEEKLEILNLKIKNGFYPEIQSSDENKVEVIIKKSYLLIKSSREGDLERAKSLANSIESFLNKNIEGINLKQMCILTGALSYYYLRPDLEKSLYLSERSISILEGSKKSKLNNHLLANEMYHQAKIKVELNEKWNPIPTYLKILSFDDTFYDYHYQLALAYQEIESYKLSKNYYTKALKISVFDTSLVNDFGCLLDETDDEKVVSWKALAVSLGEHEQ